METIFTVLEKLLPVELAVLIIIFIYFLKLFKDIATDFISIADRQSKYLKERVDSVDKTTHIFERTIKHQEKDLSRIYEQYEGLQNELLDEREKRIAAIERQKEEFLSSVEKIEGRKLTPEEIDSITSELEEAKDSAELIYQLANKRLQWSMQYPIEPLDTPYNTRPVPDFSSRIYEAIMTSTPDPLFVTDTQNRLIMANPAASQALEINIAQEYGKPLDQYILDNEFVDLFLDQSDEVKFAELTLENGRSYHASFVPLSFEGKRIGQICILRDVTHYKKLDLLKSEFVSTVSHDLRAPLTVLRGYSQMLGLVGDLNAQQNEFIQKIFDSADRMSQLVENLLDLGRIEAGIGLDIEIFSINDLIEQVISNYQQLASSKDISLESEIKTDILIKGDKHMILVALSNLVDNAIKFSSVGGQVQILAVSNEEYIVIEVRDKGKGISPIDQPHIFEKFYTANAGGTGLGLSLVKSIIEQHSGSVKLESQLGKGSVFIIILPRSA